ncbi:MAG: bacterial transcriptional activator domain-containing protein [Anaerolineales bacterium]|nr:bacterial transcriptional activator domain-containing protein [Anaerolineales bacterium]
MPPTEQEQFTEHKMMVETTTNLEIHLFGEPSFLINGQPLAETTSQKVDALFAYLVCHPYPHLREVLASLLFNAQSRNQANNNLRVLLSRLRRVCEDAILINRQTVRLNPAYEVWLDTAVFQQTLPQQPERALKLYRGDFLETIHVQEAKGFVEWAALAREQHRLKAIETLLQLISQYEASGQIKKAISFARQLVTIEPHHEGWHRWLIRLHLQADQPKQAANQFLACHQMMQDQFGLEPSPATQALLNR